MEKEEWKLIPLTFGFYSASSMGRIKSNKYDRFIKGTMTHYGYLECRIRGKKIEKIHRIIAETFIENPKFYPEINHINGIKTDNRVSNLEWVTRSENQLHRYRVLKLSGNIKPISMYTHDGIYITSFPSIIKCISMLHINSDILIKAIKNKTILRGCIFKEIT